MRKERGIERIIDVREKHQLVPPQCAGPGPGIEPAAHVRVLDWEWNLQPFGVQSNSLTT